MFGRTRKDACRVLDCSTCDSSPCDTKVKKDDQQTETTMVLATLTHLITIAANPTKRKRLASEEQPRATQGKAGEHAHNISGNVRFTIVIFSWSFLRSPFKEQALQVSESDSRISICLHAHTTFFFYTNKC